MIQKDSIRFRIYSLLEAPKDGNPINDAYDIIMIVAIVASLIPLAFKTDCFAFILIDKICVTIFVVDYLLRWMTADYLYSKRSVLSFLRYPISFMAIIDLVSILPSLTILNNGMKVLRILRMIRALRVLRIFKAIRYSKSIRILVKVFERSRKPLVAVGTLALIYVLSSALVIMNVEPDSFDSYFDAIYWATVSLTTVGYGDIYPVTAFGRVVAMVSSIFGIAIVALPSGIITAGYLSELGNNEE